MRWLPALSMMLVSVISYIDRNTLALLAPTILKEIGLSNEQYGYIIAAFSITYCIGNPVWGRILDRFGVHNGMAASVSLWTLASVSHVFAKGMGGFAIARAALGFGEGATFPGALRSVTQTLPEDVRSRGMALAYSGGLLGAIITPLIVTPIAVRWGWRGAFWFTGVVGALWLLSWVSLLLPDENKAGTEGRTDFVVNTFQGYTLERRSPVGFHCRVFFGCVSVRVCALSGRDLFECGDAPNPKRHRSGFVGSAAGVGSRILLLGLGDR